MQNKPLLKDGQVKTLWEDGTMTHIQTLHLSFMYCSYALRGSSVNKTTE